MEPAARPPLTTAERIHDKCMEIRELLLQKNLAYGDSALDPIRIFSQADASEQLRVRIDDKLSRLARGAMDEQEDTVLDLIGYLILLLVSQEMK